MMKGAKKAIVRAPHRLVGNKSLEDRVIIEWTKDFNMAEIALDLIMSEAKNFISAWKDNWNSQADMVKLLYELYCPIAEDNVYKAVQETPASSTSLVNQFRTMIEEMNEETTPVIQSLEVTFIGQCKQAKTCVDGVQKSLKKREHKKIDFDRHSNTVDKMFKKMNMTEKEQASLNKMEAELDLAMETFHKQDEKVKRFVPRVLNSMSEFLNPLTSILYLSELKILQIMKTHLYSFAQAQGLAYSGVEPPAYVEVVEDWESRFLTIQPQAEEAIQTIRNGKTIKAPMNRPSKTTSQKAKNMLGKSYEQTSGLANKAYQRAKHPTVSQIQFSSPSQGMFRSEADIMISAATTSAAVSSITTRSSSSSKGLTSPITSPTPGIPDDIMKSRVRAWSSSSARALSPVSMRSSQTSYSIPAKSENDEYAVALWTFSGDEPGDVAFRVGDRIRVLDHGDETDDKWWFGETEDGRLGLFPFNYVKI